jgi:hypothetical protein
VLSRATFDVFVNFAPPQLPVFGGVKNADPDLVNVPRVLRCM